MLLLDRGANTNDRDNEGLTSLMWASFYGNKVVELLLYRGADVSVLSNDVRPLSISHQVIITVI